MGKGKIFGLFLVFGSLGVYFLLPLNDIIGFPKSLLGMNTPTITISYAFNLCSNQFISFLAPQCQTINFISYGIFAIILIGIVSIIKN
ncbi:MAG: hypothetical protein WC568_00765 [Candidatus Methanoperedens sp.]